MEKKFYYAIIVAILIIAIISSWEFLFGFVIAGVIFLYIAIYDENLDTEIAFN